jgi:NAD dependent epimerase/dehydratase
MSRKQAMVDWKGRRVLVTGAGGFIGSHLAEELVRLGGDVTAFIHYNSRGDWGLLERVTPAIRRKLTVIAGDVCDPHMLKDVFRGQEVVFHLAALIPIPYSYVAPASYVETNAMGSLNVFKACMDAGVGRIVHTSTSETYGTAQYVPIDEGHPLQAQSPYAASKIAGDKIAESFHRAYDAPISTIRPFNTFGPRQSARAVIPAIMSQVLSGKRRISLGSLHPVRDLTYVKDMVRGFLSVAASDKTVGEVVNVGTGIGISIGDLVEMIGEVAGKAIRVTRDAARVRARASEVDRLICDNGKALSLCSWKPSVKLREGLRKTIDYVGKHMDLYKPEVYAL